MELCYFQQSGWKCVSSRQNEPDSERQIAQVSSPAGFEYERWAREGRRGSKETGHKRVMGKEYKTLPTFSPTENLKSYRWQGVEAGGLAVPGEARGWQGRGESTSKLQPYIHMHTHIQMLLWKCKSLIWLKLPSFPSFLTYHVKWC